MIKRLVKLLICLVFWTIEHGTRSFLSMFGKKYPGTAVVLYYHVVTSEQRQKFAHQMDILLRLARPVSPNNTPNLTLGLHHVVLTFDDGFRTSLENVLPEVEKRKIPMTVFVPTGCLGIQPPWLGDEKSKDNGGIVVSSAEIRGLDRNSLVTFGSHCSTHRPLPTLMDHEARAEIFQSKADLEDILGQRVETLSFPHGAFESKHVDWARQAGYSRVFSISPALAFSGPDEFVTGRVRVDPTDWPVEFRLKLLGAYRWLSILRHRSGSNN